MDTVTFMSYNTTGLDTVKIKFSLDVCEEYDVNFLAIQEHFKFVNSDKFFRSGFSSYSSYVMPAHRAPAQCAGRAKAGIAQLCTKQYDVKRVRIPTIGFRLQAQVLETPTSRVLWLNTYLPPDPQLQRYDDSELQDVLMEIRSIIQSAQFDDIVWGSDLNWDPSRNTQFSRTMSEFVNELGLVSLWDTHPVPYTHTHTDGRSRSLLDHFLLTPRLLSMVEGSGIVERGDNRSRHCPIWVRLRLGSLPIRKPSSKWIPRKPAWAKATDEQKAAFKEDLEAKLTNIQELLTPVQVASLGCQDVHCKEVTHVDCRDCHMLDILSAIIESTHVTLPTYGGCWVSEKRPGLSIPGWKSEVKPFRDKSIYWGNIWRQAGRPTTGCLHEIYVKVRREYHHAVLRVKRRRKDTRHGGGHSLVEADEGHQEG